MLLGRLDEAQAHLVEALRLKPEYVEARCNLGNLLVILGKLDKALPHYLEALRINPDYAEGHY